MAQRITSYMLHAGECRVQMPIGAQALSVGVYSTTHEPSVLVLADANPSGYEPRKFLVLHEGAEVDESVRAPMYLGSFEHRGAHYHVFDEQRGTAAGERA